MRQTDRQTDRQTETETDRQREKANMEKGINIKEMREGGKRRQSVKILRHIDVHTETDVRPSRMQRNRRQEKAITRTENSKMRLCGGFKYFYFKRK